MGDLIPPDPRTSVVFANVSGGKDSTALSLWLHEQGIEHRRVFADTGWEHPDTYRYLDTIVGGSMLTAEAVDGSASQPERDRVVGSFVRGELPMGAAPVNPEPANTSATPWHLPRRLPLRPRSIRTLRRARGRGQRGYWPASSRHH